MRYLRSRRCVIVPAAFTMSLIFVLAPLAGREGLAPKPLSFLPKGVALGMSAGDLQKCRPGAKEFRIAKDAEKKGNSAPRGDLTKGDHLLIEELGADSEFKGATYLLKNGVLVCITVSKNWALPKDWYLKPNQAVNAAKVDLDALRQKTFAECRERFGDQNRMDAVPIQLSDTVRYLTPRFYWTNNGVGAAFNCTSEYQDVDILQGFVSIATWLTKDDFKPPLPPAQGVDNEVLSRLAQPVLKSSSRKD